MGPGPKERPRPPQGDPKGEAGARRGRESPWPASAGHRGPRMTGLRGPRGLESGGCAHWQVQRGCRTTAAHAGGHEPRLIVPGRLSGPRAVASRGCPHRPTGAGRARTRVGEEGLGWGGGGAGPEERRRGRGAGEGCGGPMERGLLGGALTARRFRPSLGDASAREAQM